MFIFVFCYSLCRRAINVGIGAAVTALIMVVAHTSVYAQTNLPSYSGHCYSVQAAQSQWQSIIIPHNAPNNTAVGNWFSLPVHSWNCTFTRTNTTSPNTRNANITPGISPVGTITVDGKSYSVYPISSSLGYVAQWSIGGCYTSQTTWAPMGSAGRTCSLPIGAIGQPTYSSVHVSLQVRLVKRANLSPGAQTTTFQVASLRIHPFNAQPYTDGYHYPYAYVQYTVQGPPPPPTCNVSAQPTFINLGSVTPSQIPFVNSGANQQPFNFMLQCTAGTGQVKYRLESYPTAYTLTNNVLPNAASGPAYGVGIQILNSPPIYQAGTAALAVRITCRWRRASCAPATPSTRATSVRKCDCW